MTKLTAFAAAALLLVSAAVAAPAFAMDNNHGTTITKDSLEADGYTCTHVSTGFWECTKPGGTTYWCDTGSCQPKPFRSLGDKFKNATKLDSNTVMLRN